MPENIRFDPTHVRSLEILSGLVSQMPKFWQECVYEATVEIPEGWEALNQNIFYVVGDYRYFLDQHTKLGFKISCRPGVHNKYIFLLGK